ncbi:MAG: hypothetical protein ACAH17_00065, partial [Candidatus Paceibacterota bacterium]
MKNPEYGLGESLEVEKVSQPFNPADTERKAELEEKFEPKEAPNEQAQKMLLQQTVDLGDSYEKLRGKNDEASVLAKQFILSQSEMLEKKLFEQYGVSVSPITPEEVSANVEEVQSLQPSQNSQIEVSAQVEPTATTSETPVNVTKPGFFKRFRDFFGKQSSENVSISPADVSPSATVTTPEKSAPEKWLPYKTPINIALFNDNPVFKNTMLSLPMSDDELGAVVYSGEIARELAKPAVEEMERLQKD